MLVVSVADGASRSVVGKLRNTTYGVHGWSPDGTKILFSRFQNFGTDVCCSWDLMTANSDGGESRVLRHYQDPIHGGAHPSWSPDSRSIALISEGREPSLPHCSILSVATGKLRWLRDCRRGFSPAVWSPDSTRIVIAPRQVYNVRNQSAQVLDRSGASFSWSRDGQLTFVSATDTNPSETSVYANRNGRGPSKLLLRLPDDEDVISVDPR